MDRHSADLSASQGAPALTGGSARPTASKRSFASLLFGYDIFLSFPLGPPPRGTLSYASDLARRLRERDCSVFFSEEEAPPGEVLDSTLRAALLRSKTLAVIANRGTLQEPRWVRKEVEEFRKHHPDRPVITINVGGALQDATLAESAQEWLDYQGKIWLDESAEAVTTGIASGRVIKRLSIAPTWLKSNVKWRWVRNGAIFVLAALAIVLGIVAKIASDNASEAIRQRLVAEERARIALSRQLAAQATSIMGKELDTALLLSVESSQIHNTLEAQRALRAGLEHKPQLITFLHVNSAVSTVAFSRDSKLLASVNEDGKIILWNVETHKPVNPPLESRSGKVQVVAFSPKDDSLLASGSEDGKIILWNVETHKPLGELEGHSGNVDSIAFSHDGKTLTACDGVNLHLWDVAKRRLFGTFGGEKVWILCVAFSPKDDSLLAAGRDDGKIILWNVKTRKILGELEGHSGDVDSVAFSPDGEMLVSGGCGKDPGGIYTCVYGEIFLWDVETRKLRDPPFEGASGRVHSVAFNPDGNMLVSGGCGGVESDHLGNCSPGEILLWDVKTRQPLRMRLTAQDRFVASVAFSPDGKTLASGGFDRNVILWNLTTTHPFGQPFTGSQNSLPVVLLESSVSAKGKAFDPKGKILAIGDGKTITFQDAKTRQPLGPPLEGHTGPVLTAGFSPDGTLLATGGCGEYDIFRGCAGEVALWNVEERMLIGMPFTGIGRVISVAFSSDGKVLFSRADPPLAHPFLKQPDIFQWDVSIESWRDRACRIANRNLTCKEWRQYLGSEHYHNTCPDPPRLTEECK